MARFHLDLCGVHLGEILLGHGLPLNYFNSINDIQGMEFELVDVTHCNLMKSREN